MPIKAEYVNSTNDPETGKSFTLKHVYDHHSGHTSFRLVET